MHFYDPAVSNQHVKIFSIAYDQGGDPTFQPLVYAENLSSNGSYWNGQHFSKGQGGVLLSDGDILQLSSHVKLVFRAIGTYDTYKLESNQAEEAAVSAASSIQSSC